MSKVDIGAILGVVKTVVSSEAGQSYVCGTYFDGMPCSISIGEAWHDGYISPKDRLRWAEEQNKKVKEKRKQRKKQKKKAKKANIQDVTN